MAVSTWSHSHSGPVGFVMSGFFIVFRSENVTQDTSTQAQVSSFTARDKRERARGNNQVDDSGHEIEPYRLRSGLHAILPRDIIVAQLRHNSQISSRKTLPPRDTPLRGCISPEYKPCSQFVCLQLSPFYPPNHVIIHGMISPSSASSTSGP